MIEERHEVLRRFYRILVKEFRSRPPWDLSAQFYLSDLYNNLVPFEVWGERLGLGTEVEYDRVLMRLLAGEGDYLRLGSEKARREIEAELTASEPILGVYRDFAPTEIRLNPERTDEILTSEGPAGTDPDPGRNLPDGSGVFPVLPGRPREEPGGEGKAVLLKSACSWCEASLPNRKHLNFCPFCGKSVRVMPCPACREELEPEWRFCIACGAQARPATGQRGRRPVNRVMKSFRAG
jgi:hypothetical protein